MKFKGQDGQSFGIPSESETNIWQEHIPHVHNPDPSISELAAQIDVPLLYCEHILTLTLKRCDKSSTIKMFSAISNLQPRQLAAQVLNFALVLSTAFMLWKGLSVFSNSSSPIVVVLSGSMEPAFQRGDLLFLWNRGMDTQVGEVVVYNVRGKDIPIVHRVIRRFGGG